MNAEAGRAEGPEADGLRAPAGRILGFDPGSRVTGYGCVDRCSDRGGSGVRLVEAGVLRLAGSRDGSLADRLVELDRDVSGLIGRLRPGLVAVEALFAHPAHPATAIVMAHARGVILLAARRAGVGLVEFKPNLVKRAVVGHGLASKPQVQRAVRNALGLESDPSPPDVADALAVALCAAERSTSRAGAVDRSRVGAGRGR